MKAKTQIWGFLLFPLSMILLISSTAWLGLLYSFFSVPIKISFKGLLQRWHQYFLKMAISIDQLGNVVLQDLFNDLLITTKSQHSFGDEDETISSVLGKNKATHSPCTWGILSLFPPALGGTRQFHYPADSIRMDCLLAYSSLVNIIKKNTY